MGELGMSQNVVYPGTDFVFAFHPNEMDLTGIYDQGITLPDGTTTGPPDIVVTPYGFIYAYDELGRRLDPRRFAGDGGTPLGGPPVATPYTGKIFSAPPRRPQPPAPKIPPIVVPPPPEPAPEPPPEPKENSS
jgi:hypothetical protein